MSPSTGRLATCIAMLIALMTMTGCGSGSAVVASVGKTDIEKTELDHWTGVELAVDGPKAPSRTQAQRLALGLLISWQWTLGEATQAGIAVSEREAERQWALTKSGLNGGHSEWFRGERLLAKFVRSGRVATHDQIEVVRLGLLASKLAEWRVSVALPRVGRDRILSFYELHKHRLLIGERRDIKAIINSSLAKVLQAKREMQAGVKFEKVAERFNQSIEGGLRLGRARGAGTKRYEIDYFAAPLHVLIGPLKERLYYIFEVMSIKPRRQKTLAEAEPGIRRLLAAQDADSTLLKAYERKWQAVTSCRTGYSAAECRRS